MLVYSSTQTRMTVPERWLHRLGWLELFARGPGCCGMGCCTIGESTWRLERNYGMPATAPRVAFCGAALASTNATVYRSY